MANPLHLLKCVAKAAGNAFGAGFAGDVVFELLPELANDAVKWWRTDRNAEQRRQDLAAVAVATPHQVKEEVQAIVAEEVPFLYIMYWDWYNLFRKRVKGLPESALAGDNIYAMAYQFWIEE